MSSSSSSTNVMNDASNLPSAFKVLRYKTTMCCLGAGRLGTLSMMVLARQWPDIHFVVLDSDVELINSINQDIPNGGVHRLPFFEPGSGQLLQQCPNLEFSSHIHDHLLYCQLIFIAVDIPLRKKPREAKNGLSICKLETAIRSILGTVNVQIDGVNFQIDKYIAIKSTLPLDCYWSIHDLLRRYRFSEFLHVLTIPEFFSEGTAVDDMENPPRIAIGNFLNVDFDTQAIFHDLYLRLVNNDGGRIDIIGSNCSVELGKLISNSIIAAQVTLINIASSICDGSTRTLPNMPNIEDVKNTIRCHPRVSQSFLDSTPGYGGLGLTKDIDYLGYLCGCYGLHKQKKLFKVLKELRIENMDRFVQKVVESIGCDKTIALFGFSNKVGTDDVRESPSLYIARALLENQTLRLIVHDPVVDRDRIRGYFAPRTQNRVAVADNLNEAWGVEVMIFMVNWPVYRDMLQQQRNQMLAEMRIPRFIFDCCDLIGQNERAGANCTRSKQDSLKIVTGKRRSTIEILSCAFVHHHRLKQRNIASLLFIRSYKYCSSRPNISFFFSSLICS